MKLPTAKTATPSTAAIERRNSGSPGRLETKFSPPAPLMHEIERIELCRKVVSEPDASVVLVRGAAGFGKTTFMRQLLERCRHDAVACSWITLEPADNDINRFVDMLSLSLGRLIPGVDPDMQQQDQNGGFALHLIDCIADANAPFCLFLDDFETLHNPAVLALIQQLIAHLPQRARVIIGSRTLPDLGLGRLRARGALLEVGSRQLRFSVDEASDLLTERRHLELQGEQITRIHERTEGWPAALWLVSIALAQHADPTTVIDGFSGSYSAVAEYLAEEVLVRQPESVKTFLLRTSIVDHFSAALSDAICDRNDSASVLAELERDNLFLIALGDRDKTYRYHALFKEFLYAQLQRLRPDEVVILHRRAAQWYLEQGRIVPAIEHALLTRDLDFALPLLSRHAGQLLDDMRMRLLARWLGGLPTHSLKAYPYLRVVHVWVINFTRSAHSALTMLDSIEDWGPLDAHSNALLIAVRPTLLSLADRQEEAYDLGMTNIGKLGAADGFARCMLDIQLATVSISRGAFAEARQRMDDARKAQALSAGGFGFALAEALEGEIDLLRGRLRQASLRLRDAVEPRVQDPTRHSRANAMAGVLLAEVLYERDECESAERLLNVYVPFIAGGGMPDQLIGGHVLHARIMASRKDDEQAFQILNDLEFMGYRFELKRLVLSARVERARLFLNQGKLDAAREELTSARDDELWARASRLSLIANDIETFEVGELRWRLRAGDAAAALPDIVAACDVAERAGRFRRALKLRIMAAEALYHLNDEHRFVQTLGQALTQASTEGFIRIFTDEGAIAREMLQAWQKFATPVQRDVFSPDYLAALFGAAGLKAADLICNAGTLQQSQDPLTRKERLVLGLMAEGLTNRALADRLFLSEATIRTHLRNINSKLNVHSRVQAIAAGRRLGVID